MGCDGGTIPRRDELVRVKKKDEVKDKDSELAFQWRYCYLSQQLLQNPIVMCGLGHLYNKVTLIEGLLNRQTLPKNIKHIKSLKDVKDLNLTPNPEFKPVDDKKEGGLDSRAAQYICPVIGLEMSGKHRFIGLWSCGCVFSERASKEIDTNVCHKCQAPFTKDNVVILNGTEDDLILMKQNMENRQLKNKKKKVKIESCATITSEVGESSNNLSTNEKRVDNPTPSVPTPSVPTSSGSTELSVKGIVRQFPIKRQGETPIMQDKIKKVKQNYSVAKDPGASDVYKSIFTTHQSEQNQSRAHWITYNPFYN